MLEQKLRNEIWMQMGKHPFPSDPVLIITHPKTWDDLTREMLGDQAYRSVDVQGLKEIKYAGIRVIRSLDIENGEFLVI